MTAMTQRSKHYLENDFWSAPSIETWPLRKATPRSPRLMDSLFKSDKSDWLKTAERVLCACSKIRTGQGSRFLVLTKRIAAFGEENVAKAIKAKF